MSFPVYNYYKSFSIYQGFRDFIKEEILSGNNNQYYCQKCKYFRDLKLTKKIFYTPPYLIIKIDYGKNKKYKPIKIEFGEVIDLSTFIDINCKKRTYELKAVISIEQSGNMDHYIAYCKDNHGLWHEFNDSIHKNCDFMNVKTNPYLLFFKNI